MNGSICLHICTPVRLVIDICSTFTFSQNLHPGIRDTVKRWNELSLTQKIADKAHRSVSSNCALRLPSTVVAVQLSCQWNVSQLPPRLIICKLVKNRSFRYRERHLTGSIVKVYKVSISRYSIKFTSTPNLPCQASWSQLLGSWHNAVRSVHSGTIG